MKISTAGWIVAAGTALAMLTLATGGKMAHAAPATASADAALSEGEVKKVDKDAGKITIKHGPLVNLDLPPMTTVFRVKDKSQLDRAKSGDRIRFRVEKVDGAYTVMRIDTAQ